MSRLLDKIRRRLGYLRPVYTPGYVPGLTWWQIALGVAGAAIVILLIILFARERYWRYQYAQNPIFVTTYATPRETPSDENSRYKDACTDRTTVDGLIACIGFTDEGEKLLRAMNPNFADEPTVAEKCNAVLQEGQAIFGCWNFYNGEETVTILNPTDPLYGEFNESPEVSLVHEFLHGVYYHMTIEEQRSIYLALSSEYADILDEIISLGYDYSDVDDELFTRVGSEQTEASDAVRQIYAQYLTKWSDQAAAAEPADVGGDGDAVDTTAEPPAQPVAPANHTNADYQSLPSCTVTKVSDGDTLYVDCLPQRIRMIGVDTPESTNEHQCYGNEASSHADALLGQKVYLETDPASGDTDTYGRYLRYIYLADGTNYNMQLIEGGYGMNYVFGGQTTKYGTLFKDAENAARSAGRGLWSVCQTAVNRYGNYEVVN